MLENKDYEFENVINIKDLKLKKNDLSGEVRKVNNEIIAYYITDNNYCAYGPKDKLIIAKACSDIDIIIPTLEFELNGKEVTILLKDEGSGITGYCVTNGSSSDNCDWSSIDRTNETTITYEISKAGTYYLFTKDAALNISDSKTFTVGEDLFCNDKIGQSSEYDYEENEQIFNSFCSGNYRVEVWGAQGTKMGTTNGGLGSYAYGTISLSDSDKLSVYVGGSNGYNGGATGYTTGGGATDVRQNGTDLAHRIIVAGGGSGVTLTHYTATGGTKHPQANQYNYTSSGVPSSNNILGIGTKGTSTSHSSDGTDGGHETWATTAGGGGGGYYGGLASYAGTSYINSTLFTDSAITTAVRNGNGHAKITYLGQ